MGSSQVLVVYHACASLSDLGTLQPGIRAVVLIFGIDFTSLGLIVLLKVQRWET